MSSSRREFIKFVVAGSVAAGCPIDETLFAGPESKSAAAPLVHGEHEQGEPGDNARKN